MWISFNGCNAGSYEFPYDARSLTLNKIINFKEKEDVLIELERCYDEAIENGYSVGQALYYQHLYFANTQDLVDPNSQRIIKEYLYCKESNTPPFKTIQETPASYIDQFMIIQDEIREFNKVQTKGK